MYDVISLKRLIDTKDHPLRSALTEHSATLGVIGEAGAHVCPAVGTAFRESLLELQKSLAGQYESAAAVEIAGRAREQIRQWGEQATRYYRDWAAELKEALLALAQTADAAGERSQLYTERLTGFRERLETAGKLDDLAAVREVLVRSAGELKICVEEMAQESRATIEQLRSELSSYQGRLEGAERMASVDSITGLDNRQKISRSLDFRIAQKRPFSIILFQVNGLERINSRYGRVACDQTLMQFGTELRAAFRATDVLGRWSETEFIAILECGEAEASQHIERVRQWCLGTYLVQVGRDARKVNLDASAAAAQWRPGEQAAQTVARATAAIAPR